MIDKSIYSIYGLPSSYFNITYEDTQVSKVKAADLRSKIPRAPSTGTLTVQGTAAPIVNQLLDTRKVRGINFAERSSAAFETHENPTAEVIVLYGVGNEISLNNKVSSMVLHSILKAYKNKNTLVIIESDYTKSELLSRYDFHATNFVKLLQKEEEVWLT